MQGLHNELQGLTEASPIEFAQEGLVINWTGSEMRRLRLRFQFQR